uniref:Signal peptidase complex catalytic subunit SEC11 n=1 Tax=Meleagris gallopavo TaxID=9103 RepID=G1MQK1_MELGA
MFQVCVASQKHDAMGTTHGMPCLCPPPFWDRFLLAEFLGSDWVLAQPGAVGSMEPAFHRGDLLFLTNRIEDPIRVGEIVVFRIEGREIPIVHRVLKIHEKQNGDIKFLTKGDNNAVDDRGLYKRGQHWLEKKDVVGRARGFVPYIGIVTILMNDYPKFKYAVLFLLGLFVLVHRE